MYFVHKYSSILQLNGPEDFDKLHDEFIAYQLFQVSDIPDSIWKEAEIRVDDNEESKRSTIHRMDVIWGYLSTCTLCDGTLRFAHLSKVACLVLLIPHSNAEEERVFSMIKKNKTDFRNRLSLNATVSSILTVKLTNPEAVTMLQMGTNQLKF